MRGGRLGFKSIGRGAQCDGRWGQADRCGLEGFFQGSVLVRGRGVFDRFSDSGVLGGADKPVGCFRG